MRTLIVPCAGKSTRFPNMKPKWMLYYPDNKMMLEKAVEGLDTNEYDRIIFTVVREHVEKYAAKDVIEEIFSQRLGEKMQICVLEDFTSCQAETVYLTLKKCNVEGCFEVKDSDNYICIGKRNNPEFVAGVNVSTFPKEINRLAAKSFLVLNEQNIITDIVEKRIRSEYISVGLYGFKDVRTFSDAYMHLRDVSESNYEIYLSHIISYLIGTQASVYSYEEAIEYEDWGTLTDWNNTLCEKKTYVINMDGIVLEKCEPYGEHSWKAEIRVIGKNIQKLRELNNQGAQLILLTVIPEEYRSNVEKALTERGIEYHALIMDCYISQKTLIGIMDKSIPTPQNSVINLVENESLETFM